LPQHPKEDNGDDPANVPLGDDGAASAGDQGQKPDKGDGAKPDKGNGAAPVDAKQAEQMLRDREEKQFDAAEHALRQAIQDVPELRNLADSLVIDRTPEGLRIQIVDQDRMSMFPLGSSDMVEPARRLMTLIAQVVKKLPEKIAITGHTDANPYTRGGSYGNWELSVDRANASRRELLTDGIAAERVTRVVGVAEREPLVADPLSPRNRRISIVLLRQAPPPPGAPQKPAGG
jgi:chemotaxis protein MotB